MFRTVALSVIRSFSLYTQQWYISYRFADGLRAVSGRNWVRPDTASNLSAKLCDINHCCVYSEKLLMMNRGTVRNMENFIPPPPNEKLVHPVGLIIGIYHDARSPERQKYISSALGLISYL